MALDRRRFLRNILGGSAVAVAAAAYVKLEYVPEIKQAALDELEDLEQKPADELLEAIKAQAGDFGMDEDGKIIVSAPKKVFHPDARVWKSVANEAGAWADYLAKEHGVSKQSVLRACKTLARACDTDLKRAEIESSTEIVVDLPHVTRQWTDSRGEKQIEIAMGVEQTEVLGHDRWRVGFIGQKDDSDVKLVDAGGYDTIAKERENRARIAELEAEKRRLESEIDDMKAERVDSIDRSPGKPRYSDERGLPHSYEPAWLKRRTPDTSTAAA